ncbi:MAG TPA: Clp protease N-terminal domain-containing protein [Actinopolymorphaceae bacterium]
MVEWKPLPNVSASMRDILLAAIVEAQRLGSSTVEAEHILLAVAADSHSSVGAFLAEEGLDHAAVLAALRHEREQALQSVGVAPRDPSTLVATRIGRPKWGQSARLALRHAQHAALGQPMSRHHGRQRIRHRLAGENLLYGILSLELGTVPRALALAGHDRQALLARLVERAGMLPPRSRGRPNRE